MKERKTHRERQREREREMSDIYNEFKHIYYRRTFVLQYGAT